MDIKELDKKQLVLLTLLITFVVSIATGIVTVSLMNQMPKSVPQTINNVIQRTIEKVTTVQVPTPDVNDNEDTVVSKEDPVSLFGDNADALVSIYLKNTDTSVITSPAPDSGTSGTVTPTVSDGAINNETVNNNEPVAIGQGIIVSDIGLILVDSNIIKEGESYKVILNKIEFNASMLKKFDNGFTILKISPMTNDTTTNTDTTGNAQ